jgi:hypothetical protein
MMPLARFFEAMAPFLDGRSSSEDLVGALGPSASGSDRLSVYPWLVRHEREGVLEALYAPARRLAEGVQQGLWETLVREYTRESPPRHWDPNRFGEHFPAFLGARRHAAEIMIVLEEIADFCWIRFHVARAANEGLGTSIFVRRYTHDVPCYVGGGARSADGPERRAVNVLVYRSLLSRQSMYLYPSGAGLVALARRSGPANRATPSLSVPEGHVERAELELVRKGVVSARKEERCEK